MPANDTQNEKKLDVFCITVKGSDYFFKNSSDRTISELLEIFEKNQNLLVITNGCKRISKSEYEHQKSDKSLTLAHIDKDGNRLTVIADGEVRTFKLNDYVTQIKCEKTIGTPAKLLPILNTSYNKQLGKIDSFYTKRAVKTDKIKRNKNKISKHKEKIERLSSANDMLKSMFGKNRIVAAIIAKNEKKIDNLKNYSIPNCESKITKHTENISKLDHKIEIAECKAAKSQALSGIIKSFAVKDVSERRKQFAENLDKLHTASNKLLGFKLEKCEAQIGKLNEKYISSDSALEKNKLAKKLDKLNTRKQTISEKMKKLSGVERPFSQQSDKAIDNMAEKTISHLDNAMKTENISGISESVCEKNIEQLKKEEKSISNNSRTFSEKSPKSEKEVKKEEKSNGFTFSVSKLKEKSEMVKSSQKNMGEVNKAKRKDVSL